MSDKKIREVIMFKINSIKLPGFIYLEIEKILPLLNSYKLNNLYKNIDLFINYLSNLNSDYNLDLENLLLNEITNEK